MLTLAQLDRGPAGTLALAGVLGVLAVYLLLPRPKPYPRWLGLLAAAAALVVTGVLVLRVDAATVEVVLFYLFAAAAVISGGLLLQQRNPVRAALAFALVVLATCGLFLLQAAPFLMAATVIVYAGAIIVTFLFVIMLAQQGGPSDADFRSREPLFTTVAGFLLLVTLCYVLQWTFNSPGVSAVLDRIEAARRQDSAAAIGRALDLDDLRRDVNALTAARGDEPAAKAVGERVLELETNWAEWTDTNNAAAMRTALARLAADVRLLNDRSAHLQPDKDLPLSAFSGVPANLPPGEVRRDRHGYPALPAANVAALGRSLFSDFLLPVELAGTLLLVATIGAIAVASRRSEGLR